MAIYYYNVQIIGGNSGRSAVGAAAYRAGEKLRNERDGMTHDYRERRGAVSAAAYHSGGKLNDGNATRDFRKKSGIIHSEIMLPSHAPKEYQDRGTLWNAATKSEKQHNARIAREIVVALPNELTAEQNIEMLRDYIKRNFVNEGMCADFSIHSGHKDAGQNNPHAHIMLTVRPINKDGTWGAKSKKEYVLDRNGQKIKLPSGEWKSRKVDATNWDKKETLVKWRKDWALTANKEFARLNIAERIDHRTLEAQGVDRLPTVHLGHEAHNLEKRGIKTRRGDINREIGRINAEVAKINERIIILEKQRQIENIRLINQAIKPNESVREYIEEAKAQNFSEQPKPIHEAKPKEIENIRLINQPVKPLETVQNYVREVRTQEISEQPRPSHGIKPLVTVQNHVQEAKTKEFSEQSRPIHERPDREERPIHERPNRDERPNRERPARDRNSRDIERERG